MYRLSLIISEIYNKYLPLAEKDGIILNLDFSDTTKEIADPERVKKYLSEHLDSTLKRSDKGEVTIGVDKEAITITDTGTTLSHAACALLSNRFIDVTSRVGFGTTVKIFLMPREAAPRPTIPPVKVEELSVGATVDKTPQQTTVQSAVKVTTIQGKKKLGLGAKLQLKGKKSVNNKAPNVASKPSLTPSKTNSIKTNKPKSKLARAKTQRQLAAAAKKADRDVKRIAKKASKQLKKSAKVAKANKASKTPKPAKTSAQPAKKKPVRKLKLS